jgi:DNA-binding transcriptional LysR family regulator
MDRFHALTAFARVVETGSFARAAERLGVSVSSVSRLVADLEAHLDARLLNRTTRRLSLTESGQAFFERCVQVLADLEEAEVAVASASIVPRGTLRPFAATFAACHFAPAIAAPRRAMRRSGSTSSSPSVWSTSWRKASTSRCALAPPAARTSSGA